MASRMQVVYEDDVDGSAADKNITFSIDGVSYEIDLSNANAEKFYDAIAPWIGHARKTGGRKARGTSQAASSRSRDEVAEMRTWARQNGYQVSDRGRVSATIREAYAQAH